VPLAGLEDRIVSGDVRGIKFEKESGVLREARSGQRQRGLRLMFLPAPASGDWGFLQKIVERHIQAKRLPRQRGLSWKGLLWRSGQGLSTANVKALLFPISFDVPGLHRFTNKERPQAT